MLNVSVAFQVCNPVPHPYLVISYFEEEKFEHVWLVFSKSIFLLLRTKNMRQRMFFDLECSPCFLKPDFQIIKKQYSSYFCHYSKNQKIGVIGVFNQYSSFLLYAFSCLLCIENGSHKNLILSYHFSIFLVIFISIFFGHFGIFITIYFLDVFQIQNLHKFQNFLRNQTKHK